MKKIAIRCILCIGFIALMPNYSRANDSTVINLNMDQAIEIALSKNPTIKIADQEIKKKDYYKKEVMGGLLPSISATGQFTRVLKKQVMYIDGGFPGMPSDSTSNKKKPTGMSFGRDNQWSAGFNMQFPIIAPALWKSIQLSEIDIQNSMEKARASRLSLINEVKNAYYSILMATDSYEVLKQSYENAKVVAATFRNKFDQGKVSEYDVIRAEVQVKNLEPGLLQAENGIKLAKLQLKVLMGVDMTVMIEPTTQLSDYEKTMFAETMSIDTSLHNNTTLKQLDIQTKMMEKLVSVQKASLYPVVAANGMYNWISQNNNFKFKDYMWDPYSTIGISVSIPIFQGGQRYNRIKQAEISAFTMKYQREDILRKLTMQVTASMDDIQKSLKQIASNKEGVVMAEKANTIMQKSFEIGSATIIDLNDANLALTSSRLAYYQAIYNYLVAKANIELVLGDANLNQYQK